MHNVSQPPPTPCLLSLLLLPISLSLSFHPMSFAWRDGGELVMEGNGEMERGEKKDRGDEPLSFFFAPSFSRKKRETRNSVLSIVLTRMAEWCDDAKIGEDLL